MADELLITFSEDKTSKDYFVEMFGKVKWRSPLEEFEQIQRGINKVQALRNEQNEFTKQFVEERNKQNRKAKQIKNYIHELKATRQTENDAVKTLKQQRSQIQLKVKEAKLKFQDKYTTND